MPGLVKSSGLNASQAPIPRYSPTRASHVASPPIRSSEGLYPVATVAGVTTMPELFAFARPHISRCHWPEAATLPPLWRHGAPAQCAEPESECSWQRQLIALLGGGVRGLFDLCWLSSNSDHSLLQLQLS